MADLLRIPLERVPAETLLALLEEYASRDGTDYGQHEMPLAAKRDQLHTLLKRGDLVLLFDGDSETWDLVDPQRAKVLLGESGQ